MKRFLYLALLPLFIGCGGGGSGSPEDTSSKTRTAQQTNSTNAINAEPYFKYQWYIDSNTSSLERAGYTIDADAHIHIEPAWRLSRGKDVIVAVIDDGADMLHEDLEENIVDWYNADEDSFVHMNPGNSHGNRCAGIIAAPVNGKGITGIAPEAKLMIIRQLGADDAATIRAFEYAKENGAKVINCSWGTYNVSDAVAHEIKSLYDANITVVFAAGNDYKSLDDPGINDESELPWVIGVGASNGANQLASYSNYGSNIDLLAPGGDFLDVGILSLDDMGQEGSYSQNGLVNDNYAFVDGTSFSAPIVCGVAALLYAYSPGITPAEIRSILTGTADKIENGENGVVYDADGFNEKRAYGKVNAQKAFEALSSP